MDPLIPMMMVSLKAKFGSVSFVIKMQYTVVALLLIECLQSLTDEQLQIQECIETKLVEKRLVEIRLVFLENIPISSINSKGI